MLITIISCLSKKRLNKIWVIRNNVEAFSWTLDNRHKHVPKYKRQTLIVQIFYQISQRLIIWNQRNCYCFGKTQKNVQSSIDHHFADVKKIILIIICTIGIWPRQTDVSIKISDRFKYLLNKILLRVSKALEKY